MKSIEEMAIGEPIIDLINTSTNKIANYRLSNFKLLPINDQIIELQTIIRDKFVIHIFLLIYNFINLFYEQLIDFDLFEGQQQEVILFSMRTDWY